MPAIVATIISVIQAIAKDWPQISAAFVAVKNFIANLFSAGVIDKATQDALHAHVDAVAAAIAAGKELPEWTVEPDPTTPATPSK